MSYITKPTKLAKPFMLCGKHANRLLSSDDTVVESLRLNIVLSVLMVL